MSDTSKTLPVVKIGQLWKDLDKRMTRTLQVMAIEETHAICQSWSQFGGATGPKTRIRLDRFKKGSTGFELVKDTW